MLLEPFGLRSNLPSFQFNHFWLVGSRSWVLIYRLLVQELDLQTLIIALADPHSRVRFAEDLLVISAWSGLHNLVFTFIVLPI